MFKAAVKRLPLSAQEGRLKQTMQLSLLLYDQFESFCVIFGSIVPVIFMIISSRMLSGLVLMRTVINVYVTLLVIKPSALPKNSYMKSTNKSQEIDG